SDLKTSRANVDFYRSGYKTLVKLNEGIVHKQPNFQLYSNWDGTGSDIYLKLSFYKAVSEALERWCYYSVCDDDKYGFDLDKTTNGMAAFPSIFTKTVRENARFEAFERWSI